MAETHQEIVSVLTEARVFPPPQAFSQRALLKSMEDYQRLWDEAARNPDKYWGDRAREELYWKEPFQTVLEWKPPHARWFVEGRTNLAYNCLDRHLATRRDKPAILFEGEPGDRRSITYGELSTQVNRLANGLKSLGIKKGDRVGIYLPMVPEAAVAMLACARIGAVHSVVFGGFSTEALQERMNDAGAKVVLTADGGWRKGAVVPLLKNVEAALKTMTTVEKVVVLRRTGDSLALNDSKLLAWDALVKDQSDTCEPEWVESEHPLFILYTSGSTGKPKGVLHTTAGYSVMASLTTRWVFDLREDDVYWCTADVGWVTGHSYVVYGPLMNGATTVIYEGAPTHPAPDRFWDIIERYKATILYTAPTAIRAFMRLGEEHPRKKDLSSLRLLGSVGEPINPEAWMWYREVIGGGRCPVVDTWWQTETGSIMISPLPGATPTKPGSATLPLPGIHAEILDRQGNAVPKGQGGLLFVTQPWPSMLRTVYGDPERYVRTYFSELPGKYFTGDGARTDADGYFWLMGRVDDVVNVAGHRLGTAEVESALVSHPRVSEAAVVGRPDDLKGTALVAFVTLKQGHAPSPELKKELAQHVSKEIGAIARPDEIRFAEALPKTRSGKIMRRLLRDVAAGKQSSQDTTTLEDLNVLAALQQNDE
ncbi:acetate--CoA ligase [Myxococcus sp. CA051A]|uniref:Acetyl-coenzyme A synthetase n=1 Tax=Myxococcus llanfairpwllgwyngyllgogerychwyrndrobwllllantysiliogogogochensis TaxID=2590453 RepID=A0A540WTV9_9BACT|nr:MULTISPECIES: acetate--CoA ligase [Myxococcus]NTX04155.1 acetate--CoA ligase [Myxococcus sp. CA040A]NTX54466.1 acetate--CoA ligase [Myxococcus sp. CA039A]NTX61697.1 acetate--CoA ligase [Myxococcus sp. CA051A]TQF12442.1 acetate--CoA ligase [Myxococcus llanfairpwllgwyngyllgogerychwyrndrobwllllantysiliogogogochensis]